MARGQDVKIKEIPMNKIKLGRNSRLDKDDLSGLMQSINSTGLLEPIGVVEPKDGKGYEIAYGNRRFLAFSKLGLHSIPAVVHKRKSDNDVDVKNLAENVQRRNISLAEIGRYATTLEKEGLGKKELAVRLGTTVGYVEACLTAYQEVPKEYRHDLEPRLGGKKLEAGKISIKAAKSIINASKTYSLDKASQRALYEAAKHDERFLPEKVSDYVAAIKKGRKDPVGSVRPTKTVLVRMLIEEEEWERLQGKHVTDGPFRSISALARAILRGQKSERIKFLD